MQIASNLPHIRLAIVYATGYLQIASHHVYLAYIQPHLEYAAPACIGSPLTRTYQLPVESALIRCAPKTLDMSLCSSHATCLYLCQQKTLPETVPILYQLDNYFVMQWTSKLPYCTDCTTKPVQNS